MLYQSQKKPVIHREDCLRRGDALPWPPAARYSDDQGAQVVLTRFTWLRLCPACFPGAAPRQNLRQRRDWEKKAFTRSLEPADPSRCARPDCGKKIPAARKAGAIYCSRTCAERMADRARNDRQNTTAYGTNRAPAPRD